MTVTSWLALAVFAAAYVLIATELVHRVAAAVGGATVLLLLGVTDAEHAFFTPETAVDWNVILLLLGMMLIVAVLHRTGVFEFIAIRAAKLARARPFRVLVLLVLITAVASAILDNVTTVLLIAPVTLVLCRRLGVPVVPYLIAEVLASNIGGTATLVGDPPNLIIASRAGLSYNDFLTTLAPLVVVLLLVFLGLCRWLFRKSFRYDPARAAEIDEIDERAAIRDPRMLRISGSVLCLVTVGFVLHTTIDLEPSVIALAGGLVLLALSRVDAAALLRDVEWPTLVFFAGLFIMVGALVHTGVIETVARSATSATAGRPELTTLALLWGSAVLSAVVDNIPYVAAMSPVVAEIQASGGAPGDVLWWALALGADLGGNATAIGASANVVVLGIAERNGHRISFWEFSRYGLLVTVITVGLSTLYLWLRFFVWSG